MKNFTIPKGTEIDVYRGGFDDSWSVINRPAARYTTKYDNNFESKDCNIISDDNYEYFLANTEVFGVKWGLVVSMNEVNIYE